MTMVGQNICVGQIPRQICSHYLHSPHNCVICSCMTTSRLSRSTPANMLVHKHTLRRHSNSRKAVSQSCMPSHVCTAPERMNVHLQALWSTSSQCEAAREHLHSLLYSPH